MVKKFHDELIELNKEVIKMGILGREMLQKSVESLKDLDVEKQSGYFQKKALLQIWIIR